MPDRSALMNRAAVAYEQVVVPAYAKLHDFLISRYLTACRDTTDANALPNGGAMYAFNVKWHTTTEKTPREIHELGLAEVKRIRAQMDLVISSTGFKGGYEEFKTFLRTGPQFYFKDAPSLLTAYRDIAKRADPALARLFGHLPETPYGVKPVPDAIAPSQTTAYYDPGSFAAGRPAFMFANTYKLESRPNWEMEALTLHEAVPGQHIQISIAQELQGLPEFRKNSSYMAFVEGWALYAESLGGEIRGGNIRRHLREGVDHRALHRIIVDLGLHLIVHIAKRDLRGSHSRGDPLLHQGDGLVHQRFNSFEPQQDVFVILARLAGHDREDVRNLLLNPFKLIDRHEEVVRNHALERDRIVVELQAFDGCLQQVAIQIEADLIFCAELPAIDPGQAIQTVLEVLLAASDGRLGIVRPSHVLSRIPHRRRQLRMLGHPVFPILIELRTQGVTVAVSA